jgi:hypothetical protein
MLEREDREELAELETIEATQQEILKLLRSTAAGVKSFHIRQLDSKGAPLKMAIGIAPGKLGKFAAQPVNAQGPTQLDTGVVPAWVSSDPTNAPVIPSADGMNASVAVIPTAPAGTPFTLTVSALIADGTNPSGTLSVPVLALAVTSFIITQTN